MAGLFRGHLEKKMYLKKSLLRGTGFSGEVRVQAHGHPTPGTITKMYELWLLSMKLVAAGKPHAFYQGALNNRLKHELTFNGSQVMQAIAM